MRRILIGVFLVAVALTLSACTESGSQKTDVKKVLSPSSYPVNTAVQVLKVYTNLQEDSGWWVVPKKVNSMIIYADVQNAETVLFWLVPGGTQTWSERELIGYDKDGSDGWSFEWVFKDQTIHNYIYVQALGQDGITQGNKTINITTQE